MSDIDEVVRIDREIRPDIYKKADGVARIIDPAAFQDNWTIHPKDHERIFKSRLKYQRAVAISKAHEILRYLGLSEAVDWGEILSRLAADPVPQETEGEGS